MKTIQRGLLLLAFLFVRIFGQAAIITWDGGGGDGQWNTAANWVGDIVPGPADDVILDNSAVLPGYTVTLPAGAVSVSVNTLVITPLGAAIISLILPAANIGNPGLAVTGPGDALVLNNRAVFQNSSGAAAGSGISIINTFRINNGGRYIHNTQRGNAAIVSQLSAAVGTELGEFEFDVPAASYTPSLSNQTYGTLIFSAIANGGAATYIGSGINPLNINGDLVINTGVTFSISFSADVIIDRDLNQSPLSTFNLQSSTNNNVVSVKRNLLIQGIVTETNTGLPILELNGIANQNISVTGAIQNSIEFRMNNAAVATLQTPVTLPYNLTLTNGIITTTATNLLTMIDNALVTTASVTSFVEGPMKKIGDDDFAFPVGEGGIFAPISIQNSGGQLPTDEFTAQYFRQSPQAIYGVMYDPSINHISYVEYWTLNRNPASTAAKFVGLAVNAVSFATQSATLLVARHDGATWKDQGQFAFIAGPLFPPYITGALISTPVSNFSPFTLASTVAAPINPLPILFTSFTAQKDNGGGLLNWRLAEIPAPDISFDIERSPDSRNFRKIGTVKAANTSSYRFTDPDLPAGISYYRIKAKDPSGKIALSEVAAVANEEKGIYIIKIYPNPVRDIAKLKTVAAKSSITRFIITGMNGRIVKRIELFIPEGDSVIDINLGSLPAGIYFIGTPETLARGGSGMIIKQ